MQNRISSFEKISSWVLIFGDANSGKTALIKRFVKNEFTEEYAPATNLAISNKAISDNITTHDLKIMDTFGEVYYTLPNSCIIIVFDITRRESLENAKKRINALKEDKYRKDTPMILVGTKTDLENQRQVTEEEISLYCKENILPYFATSSKTGMGVDILFNQCSRLLLERCQKEPSQDGNIEEVLTYSSSESLVTQNNFATVNFRNDDQEGVVNCMVMFGKFMSHPATKIILTILLLAALAVLTYGLVGIGLAVAAGATIGTAAIASTAAGGGTVVLANTGLAILGIFSAKEKQEQKISRVNDHLDSRFNDFYSFD